MSAPVAASAIREYVLSKGYIVKNLRCRIARDGRVYAYGARRSDRALRWNFFGERAEIERKLRLPESER